MILVELSSSMQQPKPVNVDIKLDSINTLCRLPIVTVGTEEFQINFIVISVVSTDQTRVLVEPIRVVSTWTSGKVGLKFQMKQHLFL